MSEGWELPESVEMGGQSWKIQADFRDILEIIGWLNNQQESEMVRVYIALALFYETFSDMPQTLWSDALEQLVLFIGGGIKDDGPAGPKLLDWEQDRQLIVADVNKVAGCEIRALPFLHWWTFLAWFHGIGEGQLSTVVRIRDKLRRGKKLDDWEREYYQKNCQRVTLKRTYTPEERQEQERLKRMLGE